ncbi:oxaloacetate decarboxylase [Pseudomonas alkylphenolica]|uniref:Oxaloacetate decarboxylase n=1 Tax=Pseudomonas alkylphenolica TaxID=237609 RepID=A0A443ZPW1_9PSED|nr:oxaloacetate decarboxylase [Pseudomonas alkylphenolica]RWU21138.1 oxaloacetate decarboxylase [Pseudomonas alkylphenolica]
MPKATHVELRSALRAQLASPVCLRAASVFDPLSARIAADLGFEVGILGGSVVSLQVLGAPDIALVTLSEFVEQATRIGRVARLPVIADADHGYGNALNVMRTVAELERAGVAALTLEDTQLPARFDGQPTELISVEEGIGKLCAARQAREDTGLVLIARTHAGAQPLPEVIQRTRAYQDAGADGICLVGVQDIDQLAAIAEGLNVPLMLVTYGNPALGNEGCLPELGVRIVVEGHGAYFAAVNATYHSLREQRGRTCAEGLSPTQRVARFSAVEDYRGWARDYLRVQT